jgi:prepilin-type N-terminal cleavage/methylation domain-containing protein
LAKWRIGEAAPYVKEHTSFAASAPRPRFWRRVVGAHRARQRAVDGGFTLIELVVVVAVMPIVIGALSLGILSVFTLQSSVSNRLTDSDDAQLVSVNFQNDVQSAASVTTASTPLSAPAPCAPASGSGSGFQVLGLQLGNGSEISYIAAPAASGTSYVLYRNKCASGSTAPSTSTVMAHDLPASVVNPATPPVTPPVTITCTTSSTTCAGTPPAYQSDWQSTLGVTGVTFSATAPKSKFPYQLVATPIAASSSSQLAKVITPTNSCGFATAGTGQYASTLCFVDFSPWASGPPAVTGGNNCSPKPSGSYSNPLAISENLSNSPFTLDFCMSVSSAYNGGGPAITGPVSIAANARCGVAAATGWDDITASPLPTYTCPSDGSEAFLGNNGFYTGVPGDPALYQVAGGATTTVSITNITLLGANGSVASNWELVTGDAESTDGGETITWTTSSGFTLIPNTVVNQTVQSYVGNACNSTANAINTANLTGVSGPTPSSSVTCIGAGSTDKTGTVMLEAPTPNSLTVTMSGGGSLASGGGLEAMFMGVLLQAAGA